MSTPEIIFKNALNVYSYILGRGVRVSGNHSLPPGAKIIAANHTVGSDPLFLPLAFGEKPYILFQDGIFKIPVFGWFLKQCEQIPVERNSENAKKAFYKACELLSEGKAIVLFPEGNLAPLENGSRRRRASSVWPLRLAHLSSHLEYSLLKKIRSRSKGNREAKKNPCFGKSQVNATCVLARHGDLIPISPTSTFKLTS